ncbi:MAG: substrate-binding domain-containing protein [Geminicoccaceae bacterium]
MRRREVIGGLLAVHLAGNSIARFSHAADRAPLLLGVTTSTDNSGLLDHLLQAFHEAHGIEIRAITAGTGAILNMASRGDVSAVLVHAPDDEKAFVAAGYGIDRRPVMRNRYVVVGPTSDPAGIADKTNAADAFAAIAQNGALFLSRGDESGTHKAEQRLWKAADVELGTEPSQNIWYRESGSGQGSTLNIAVNLRAYCLTDEATWATFQNRGDLVTLFDRDDQLMDNLYSIILVNPERFPKVNHAGALMFADWLSSEAGQATISSFKINGKRLFRNGPDKQLAG